MGASKRFKFTRKAIDTLPFMTGSQSRSEYRDTVLPGLVLRVGKTTKTYYVIKRDAKVKGRGGAVKKLLGNTLELTPEAARTRAMKYLTADETIKEVVSKERGETIEKLAKLFVKKHVKGLRVNSQNDYYRQLENYIVPIWGARKPSTLTRTEIRDVYEKRALESVAQANKLLVVLSSMYSFALDRDVVKVNPCMRIKAIKLPSRERILTDDEIVELLTKLTDVEPVKRSYLWLLLLLGQRRTETALMQWSHLERKKGVWTIPGEITKNGVMHSVPLPPLAQAHIDLLRSRTGSVERVFYSWAVRHNREPGPIDEHNFTQFIRRFRERHMPEAPRFTLHDLRRTAATNIASLTKDRLKVKLILNHVNASDVTGVYDLYSYDEVKLECLTLWENKIREIVPKEVVGLSLV